MGEEDDTAAQYQRIYEASKADAAAARAGTAAIPPVVAAPRSAPEQRTRPLARPQTGDAGAATPTRPGAPRDPQRIAAAVGAALVFLGLGAGALALATGGEKSDETADAPDAAEAESGAQAATATADTAAPTTLTVVEDSGSTVKLAWDDPNNESVRYSLIRTPGITRPLFLGATSVTVSGLDPTVQTCFQIGLLRSGGGWDTSPEVCVGEEQSESASSAGAPAPPRQPAPSPAPPPPSPDEESDEASAAESDVQTEQAEAPEESGIPDTDDLPAEPASPGTPATPSDPRPSDPSDQGPGGTNPASPSDTDDGDEPREQTPTGPGDDEGDG